MSTTFAQRPQFFEGQYLGADDLQALLGYLRDLMRRHQLGGHTWGIAAGLELVYQASPLGDIELYLSPGMAIDGYGRTIVVNDVTPVDASVFAGQPSGAVKLWLRYDEAAGQGVRQGFEVCDAADAYVRVSESFLLAAGEYANVGKRESGVQVGDTHYDDAREALGDTLPGQPIAPDGAVAAQQFPAGDDPDLWLVPLGIVLWQGGKITAPTDSSKKQSRLVRRYAGSVGEALIGAGGLLRLGRRFLPRVKGQTVDATCDADLPGENDLLYCADDPQTPAFREPIWLDEHTRARGDMRLYGTRLEWLDSSGTDYLAQGTVTAMRRDGKSPLKGVDLDVLLGARNASAGPTRLVIGAASAVNGKDPCAVDFTLTPAVVIQEDGFVGIGSTDKVLDKPLTIRAIIHDHSLLGFEDTGGKLAWQINLGPKGNGFNLTRTDPAKSDVFVANDGKVGIATSEPFVGLTVQGSLGFKNGTDPLVFLFESGTQNPDRMVLTHSPAYQDWGLQYRDSDDSFVFLASGQSRMYVGLGNGNVGIGTLSPGARLDVRGDIKLGVNGNYFAAAAQTALAIVAGQVSAAGTVLGGSGFSAARTSEGNCNVTFSTPFGGTPTVVATVIDYDNGLIAVPTYSANGFHVSINDVADNNAPESMAFTFVAIGPRA